MDQSTSSKTASRREAVAAAVGLAAGAAAIGTAQAAPEQVAQTGSTTTPVTPIKVAKRGVYETVALRQDAINVTAIQSRVRGVDVKNLKQTMSANLKHVVSLIDNCQGAAEAWGGERIWGAKQDLICMHEFPIQGFRPWNRAELNKIAFELPGPEVDMIAQRAKKHDCYIAFGCYAKEKDWPDHVINMSVIVGPKGDIVSKQWKARNILGLFGEGALIGTTIYDVLDRYVEMYGWDATMPVARTDIGNIAMTAVGGEPLLYQCLALKGAEIMILTVTGGNNPDSAMAAARASRVYTVGVGNSVSPDNPGFAEAAGSEDEGTIIADPRGMPMARSANHHEDFVSARVPIADFRKTRRFPEYPMALFLPVFQQYEPKFTPNTFLEKLPADYREAGEIVRARMNAK
ncbi:MAG: nitrilase-related carbon-nitrogen hydrolase [Rhodospirillaceae bacterium]|nr:nitrilase-related carbon-nitrogen hydrolase [Rhodospirillaceae bacterium]